ncbi:hypothetical protein RYX36_000738 [Vicia faba]
MLLYQFQVKRRGVRNRNQSTWRTLPFNQPQPSKLPDFATIGQKQPPLISNEGLTITALLPASLVTDLSQLRPPLEAAPDASHTTNPHVTTTPPP